MRKRTYSILLAMMPLWVVATLALAHGGGLDGYGGHNDRAHGGYHFHRGPLTGKSYATKAAALAALNAGSSAEAPTSAKPDPSTDQKVEAIARILIEKGVFTRDEYLEAVAAQGKQ